jgi:hypothetical protein
MKTLLGYPIVMSNEPVHSSDPAPLIFASLDAYNVELPAQSLRHACKLIAEEDALELEAILLEMVAIGEYPALVVQQGGYISLTVTNFPRACTICDSRAINDSGVCLECGWTQKRRKE